MQKVKSKEAPFFDCFSYSLTAYYEINYTMQYFEIILSFIIGALIVATIAFVLSLKTKGIFRLLLNTLVGAIALILLNVLGVVSIPLNPLNALIVGVLGVPGLLVIFLITKFL